ncbi:hypothetical protein F4680DRAFT_463363 [Xylaria scruposa]|nr:hypothetical protein F4680DRAFT_463363 [Xylaria scruposa]
MAGSSASSIPESYYQYSTERRWPRKRGGYKIEKQCSACKWFFDSFDPEREVCHLCPKGYPPPPQVDASIPSPTVQQSELPQALPNPLQSFDVPGVANTQSGDTQYQAYGQGYGSASDPTYYQRALSSLPRGHDIPGQIWAQGYDMSFNSSYPTEGLIQDQDQAFAQGYVAFPDLSFPSEAVSNPLVEYTPNQQWRQGYGSMPIDPSSSFGTQSYPTGGCIQNQNCYQGDGASSAPSQHPDKAKTPVRIAKPLRPLLPRERTPQRPAESESESKDNDDNSQSKECGPYRAPLKRKSAHKDVATKRGSPRKGKASGNKRKK